MLNIKEIEWTKFGQGPTENGLVEGTSIFLIMKKGKEYYLFDIFESEPTKDTNVTVLKNKAKKILKSYIKSFLE